MQPTRDSSVWRSLAVAFGDGLAFGVGMKLTQTPARASAPAPAPSMPSERLEQLERRLAQIEQAPPPAPSSAHSPAFDQKVLEAVVNALDARLHEHAAQVESRLSELEAKITLELQALHRQDHTISQSIQSTVGHIQQQFDSRIDAVRQVAETGRQELHREILAIRHEVAETLETVEHRATAGFTELVRPIEERMREEFRQSMGRANSLLASASEAAVEERLRPIQQRADEYQRALLDLLQGIGSVCSQAAERMNPAAQQPPAAPPPAPGAPAEATAAVTEARVGPGSEPQPQPTPELALQTAAPAATSNGVNGSEIPAFANVEPPRPSRLWRIPLVSSLAAIGAFAGAHLTSLR